VTRPSLWFVTPAFRRFELSQVCFAQRAAAIKRLDELGIDASCVVVADDENLDIARSFGFAVVEVDNRWLGRRFNEGYAFAAEEGVDYIVPIGSDSWLDPEFFADGLPAGRGVLTSRLYASVDERGSRLSPLEIAASPGVGPHVVAVSLLEDTAYRPVNDYISRGCDGSLMRAVARTGARLVWRDLHPLQYVRLSSADEQLNPHQVLAERYAVDEHDDPWAALKACYPAEIVAAAARLYQPAPSRRRTRTRR